MSAATAYREFGGFEARGVSPIYERLSLGVSEDRSLLELIEALPARSQQPNLLFGAVRLLGGPVGDWASFRSFTLAEWSSVAAEMCARVTQTNEAGRCAVLLPVLAALPQPLALLEVGASAGLCLYPDRYSYRYGTTTLGDGEPMLDCDPGDVPVPTARPAVVWRAGLDLNPLDVTSPDDVAWLEALIWPEHEHRRARLRAAAAIAVSDPPLLVRGDLVDDLPALAARAPTGATLVVFHSSVLYLVEPERRSLFTELVATLPGHWIANEAPAVLENADLPPPGHNVLALDGVPQYWTRGHGQAMVSRRGTASSSSPSSPPP